ncbi:MAG: efflux RND transporter permease subunit [Planctomycetes bacterium]|nr:efflux RND transporter permease subunit [Planctomycetota bacterium]NOG55430.1 efflux RND transporter permease subunit [Planctomycetota bacterium]
MSLPEFTLKNRAIVQCALAVGLLWGVIAYVTSPRSENPEFTIRTCTIVTRWQGQTAEKIEDLVTGEIEKAVDTVDEVKRLRSTTTAGQSVVFVDLEDENGSAEIDNVWDTIRAKVDALTPSLTRLGAQTPVVNTDFGDTAAMVLVVYQRFDPARMDDEQHPYTWRELEVISDQIKDEIKRLPAVATAELHGVQDEAIYLECDAGHWSRIDLTISELQSLLEQRNTVAPGGVVETEHGLFGVNPSGEFNTVREIERLVVGRHGGNVPVYLRDIGISVRRDYRDPPRVMTRYRPAQDADEHSVGAVGSPGASVNCLSISLTMKSGHIVTALGTDVRSLLARLKQTSLPADIEVTVVTDQPSDVQDEVSGFLTNLYQAIAIVILVAFALIGLRVAIVMAASIPIVIIVSFGVVRCFGVHVEQISIAAFIISLGMLVDCAIEVCDNVHRLLEGGKDRRQAAIEGTAQISFPVLIATLTTIFAFLPMLTIPGSSGEFLYSLPVVVSTTLAVSWVLAMTVTCLMAYLLMRPAHGRSPFVWAVDACRFLLPRKIRDKRGGFESMYRSICLRAVRNKFITVGLALIAFVSAASLVVSGQVGTEFFPNTERDQFVVDIYLPEGSTIRQTEQTSKQVESLLVSLGRDEADGGLLVRDVLTYVGEGGPRFYMSLETEQPAPNYAMLLVNTTDELRTAQLADRLRVAAASQISGCRVVPRALSMGPPARCRLIRLRRSVLSG